jgi:hypothetical protein
LQINALKVKTPVAHAGINTTPVCVTPATSPSVYYAWTPYMPVETDPALSLSDGVRT